MFGIGGTEIVIVAVVALLLFGPDKLPQFARTVGRFLRDFKRYQDIMESTIRAEMYTSESLTPSDPFKKGKDFREKVQEQKAQAAAKAEAESAQEPAEMTGDETAGETEAVTTDEQAGPEVTTPADGEGEHPASKED